MRGFNSGIILPIVTTIIGTGWMYLGLRYHRWWIEGRAASGFLPALTVSVFGGPKLYEKYRWWIFDLYPDDYLDHQ